MATLNRRVRTPQPLTFEGAPAKRINAEQMLRRSMMTCMLWEDTFYEDGEDIAARIARCVALVEPHKLAQIAHDARVAYKLRHAPLLLMREMARSRDNAPFMAQLLFDVIQRPDELTEFLAIYWKDGKVPLTAQVKKGLALAFTKFNPYQLAKYNRDGAIKLRDVLFMVHAKPQDENQAECWKALVDGTLASPDTWEVALSGGADTAETFTRLINEHKLGALALLRNLRNMQDAGLSVKFLSDALDDMNVSRVLPYRFIAAAKYAPKLEPALERALFRSASFEEKLSGHTVLLIDNSGSMGGKMSDKSEMTRADAACSIAMLAREMCESVSVYGFSDDIVSVPPRRGFALRDAIMSRVTPAGTQFGKALRYVDAHEDYARVIVMSDEQAHDLVPNPKGPGYAINLGPYANGVTYNGNWTHLDGFSEATLKYIMEVERSQ